MNEEQLKIEISSEIRDRYKSKDIDELIDLFVSIMCVKIDKKELAGIEDRQFNAYLKIFNSNSSLSDIKMCLSDVMKVEPLLKKILLLSNEIEYKYIQDNKKGLAQIISKLGLNPNNDDLNKESSFYLNDSKCFNYISKAYQIRNNEAHTYENWTRSEIFENLYAVIISCLKAIEINKELVVKSLNKEKIKRNIDVDEYLKKLTKQFKSKISRFIHIRGEENLSFLGGYVIESLNDDSEKIKRSGTVENLRDNSVPEKRMMIWGEAGMGKSTTLEYLSYIDAQKRLENSNACIPVLVLLGLLTSPEYNIERYICEKLKINKTEYEILLEEGKLNLFIDGLNEIPNDTNLKTFRMREIKYLIDNYPNTFIIISNRPQENRDFNDKIPIFNLIKLSFNEIKDYIKKNVDDEEIKQILYKSIDGNERFVKIINTPLILSRLIEIVKYKKEVPQSEGDIIAEFLSCLFTREKQEKQDSRLDIKKMKYLLRMIAYESLERKATNSGMKESEIISYCKKSMKEYEFKYDALYAIDLATQLGILEKIENMYVFSHQAYQDYYHALEELAIMES